MAELTKSYAMEKDALLRGGKDETKIDRNSRFGNRALPRNSLSNIVNICHD